MKEEVLLVIYKFHLNIWKITFLATFISELRDAFVSYINRESSVNFTERL